MSALTFAAKQRRLLALVLLALVISAVAVSPNAVAASRCQRQIPNGTSIAFGATYIIEYRGMSCKAARKVVLTADKRHFNYSPPIDGLRCHHLNVNAGGGEEVCKAPHRLLKLAFE